MTLRIGFAGCGFIASVHALALDALAKAALVDARVVAVFDVDRARAEQFAEHQGAAVVDNVDALIDAVDVVWVCTWTAAHAEIVRAAARTGRAVYCEKPLAPTLPESEVVARDLMSVPHQVGLVLRHSPAFVMLATELATGRWGSPLATVLRDDQFFPIQGMYRSEWRKDVARAGGGTLLEHSIHDVDVLRWLLGDPERVSAHLACRSGHPGIDDVADVRFTFRDGGVATLVSVWHQVLTRPSTRRLEVFCSDAMLWLDDDHLGPLHIESDDGVACVVGALPEWTGRLELPPEIAQPLAQYAVPARAFLDAVVAGVDASPGAAEALAAHRLVDAAYRSAADDGASIDVRVGP